MASASLVLKNAKLMARIVQTVGAISDVLRRGLTPITDNEDALIELGFAREYPQVRSGQDAMVWGRSIEYSSTSGLRKLARQRAFLEQARHNAR
jgi:hypothetical protein